MCISKILQSFWFDFIRSCYSEFKQSVPCIKVVPYSTNYLFKGYCFFCKRMIYLLNAYSVWFKSLGQPVTLVLFKRTNMKKDATRAYMSMWVCFKLCKNAGIMLLLNTNHEEIDGLYASVLYPVPLLRRSVNTYKNLPCLRYGWKKVSLYVCLCWLT